MCWTHRARLEARPAASFSLTGNLPFQHHGQRTPGTHYTTPTWLWPGIQLPGPSACACVHRDPGTKGQMAKVCERRWGAFLASLHEYLSPPCVRSSSWRHPECVSVSPFCAAAGLCLTHLLSHSGIRKGLKSSFWGQISLKA